MTKKHHFSILFFINMSHFWDSIYTAFFTKILASYPKKIRQKHAYLGLIKSLIGHLFIILKQKSK